MFSNVLLASNLADMWYAMPLIVAISVVYAATRHEELPNIFRRALRVGTLITAFMAIAFVVLLFLAWWL